MPGLPKVNFTSADLTKSKYEPYPYPGPSEINLRWNGGLNVHSGEDFMLIARNSTVAETYTGQSLDFVEVAVPNWVVLAHELGHHLDELIARKKSMDFKADIVSEAILDLTPAVRVNYTVDMVALTRDDPAGILSGPIDGFFETEYKKILGEIVTDPSTDAEDAFVASWDQGLHDELLNILPAANILRNLQQDNYWGGGSSYSDGAIIGEGVINGTIIIPAVVGPAGGLMAVTHAGLVRENFVRFSHQDATGFNGILRDMLRRAVSAVPGIHAGSDVAIVGAIIAAAGRVASIDHVAAFNPVVALPGAVILPAAAIPPGIVIPPGIIVAAGNAVNAVNAIRTAAEAIREFKGLVERMLNLINVHGQPLSAANNNLPSF
jgi:hypothetical protein